MNKKYDFNKILKKYNEKHSRSYKLPPEVFNVVIIHTIENNYFDVTFLSKKGTVENEKSLPLHDFIYLYISTRIVWKDIENIILLKENGKSNLRIEIWPPNKIKHAYLHTNYFKEGVGNLGASCMRHKEMQRALNFYVKNNLKIVVVTDNNNKIHARALLWDSVRSKKLKKPFMYLDRIYTRSDTFLSLFHDLAKVNKWKRYPSTTVNKMDKNYYKKDIIIAGMCHLPYNDTFRYLYPKDNLLTAGESGERGSSVTLNHHTNCGYYPDLDPNRVQEAFTGGYISKKDATFIKRYEDNYDGYVLKSNIIVIDNTFYSNCDKKITETKLDGHILKENSVDEVITNEKINKPTAIYSTKYNGHVHKSNAINIKGDIYHKKDNEIICFKVNGVKDKWYHISQCFINYDREKRNMGLWKQKFHFWIEDEIFVPYPDDFVTRKDGLVPKEHTIIAYDLFYSPVLDDIEYQEVYCTNMDNLIQLTTGELVVNEIKNKRYLKKLNNKWYVKRDFKLPDKKQLLLFT